MLVVHQFLPKYLGLEICHPVPMKEVAVSVAIYLGIPFVAGFFGIFLDSAKGKEGTTEKFVPKISL